MNTNKKMLMGVAIVLVGLFVYMMLSKGGSKGSRRVATMAPTVQPMPAMMMQVPVVPVQAVRAVQAPPGQYPTLAPEFMGYLDPDSDTYGMV